MELTSLRYFLEAARAGSIRQAAEHIHVVPSAISRQIAKLEYELGSPLLERHSSGVRLTPAGRLLAHQLQLTERDLARIKVQIDELNGLRRGEVVIHCIEGLVDAYLPEALKAFHDLHPQITFKITVSSTDRIIEALVSDDADIGIALNAPRRPDVVCAGSWEQPLELIVAPSHPLSRRRTVPLEALSQFPAALPDTSFGVRRLIDRVLAKRGVELKSLVTTNSIITTTSIARQGIAYTLMPRFAVARDCDAGTLVAVRIEEPNLEAARVEICVHRGRNLPRAPREFLDRLLSEQSRGLAGGSRSDGVPRPGKAR